MRIFLLLSLIFFSSFSFACTCATPSLAESFEKADYVYIGQIQSSELTSETEVTNFLSIEEEFKGHRDTDILMSEVSYSSCASPSGVGYKYLIFGNFGEQPKLQSCSQTQILSSFKEELISELKKLAANTYEPPGCQ